MLALWDASEWISRFIVSLQIAAKLDPKHQKTLDSLMEDPLLSELYTRSLLRNFPGKIRNDDLATLEIVELFTQEQIAKESKKFKQNIFE